MKTENKLLHISLSAEHPRVRDMEPNVFGLLVIFRKPRTWLLIASKAGYFKILIFHSNSPLSKQVRPTYLLKSSKFSLNGIQIVALIYTTR